MVRFPVRLPTELWRVLKTDKELGKTRVLVEYWEPKMNPFIMYLIMDELLKFPDPVSFEPSVSFLPGKRVQIAVRLPTRLNIEFRTFCLKAGTSMNETIIEWLWRDEAVQAALKRHKYI